MLLMRAASAVGCNPTGPTLCNPAELADRAGVTRATMTGLIDTREKDGYVKREPDPSDRRMMTVTLTPKAEAFMRGMLPGHFRMITEVMGDLDDAERRTLVQILTKVVKRAANLNASTSAACT
jgi:DNA-binding MarR family transcriptional regulator